MSLVSEGEEELELSLGLSIGGSLKKSQKPKLDFQKSVSPTRLSSEIDFDGRDSMPFAASIGSQESNGGEDFFPREMEMHAFRRQEARKRREKQQKKRLFRKMGVLASNPLNPAIGISGSDLAAFEAQKLESRVRDRSNKEIDETQRISKQKSRRSGGESFGEENETLTQNPDPNSYPNPNSAFPMMAMQYPLHPIHYFVPPFGREGYSFPYVMPYWAAPQVAMPVSERLYPEKNTFSPASFTPSAMVDFGQNNTVWSVREDLEGDGGKGTSSGSHGSTKSHVLDNQSSSLDGGIASEMAERASPLHNSQAQSEHSASTHLLEESARQLVEQSSSNPLPQSSPSRPDNSTAQTILTANPKSPSNEIEAKKPLKQVEPTISNDTSKTSTPDHRHDHEGEVKKPLKQLEPRLSSSLTPHMPCVSTTGNGPNGKTITGFLYSYTKTDVSIVCVCHGKVFSPAEFVKHAGGTAVSHPLKHIVVVPAAFEMK